MDSGFDTFIGPTVWKPQTRLRLSDTAIRKVEGGFPHSEIPGSKLVRSSPRLIAAYHVLHRLSAPRHPPNALKALDRSRDRCPPRSPDAVKRMTIRTTRSGRKKTSDQVVSDPTAVCLPNISAGKTALAAPTDTFPLHDVRYLRAPRGDREP